MVTEKEGDEMNGDEIKTENSRQMECNFELNKLKKKRREAKMENIWGDMVLSWLKTNFMCPLTRDDNNVMLSNGFPS